MHKIITISTLLIVAYFISSAFKLSTEVSSSEINRRFQDRSTFLIESAQKVKSTVTSTTSILIIQQQYKSMRTAYKQWEYLAEQIDADMVKELNGAPLPKIEKNTFGLNIIEPKGLQTIDEILYSTTPLLQKTKIIELLNEFISQVETLSNSQKLYDKDVFIGSRVALIRIMNLSLTGFEVPGSNLALSDVSTVLTTLRYDLLMYESIIADKDDTLSKRIKSTFDNAIIYVKKNKDFDTFDRLYFLTEYINPLYKDLLTAHTLIGLETPSESGKKLPPYNYMSDNLFSNSFLDAHEYTKLPKKFRTPSTIELGKMLFFDPILSQNNQRSCASCHNPNKAFTDQLPKSIAFNMKGNVARNSPTLINCVYSERFFHDLRAQSLEDQTEHVFTSPKEFNSSIQEIMQKLRSSSEYVSMFKNIFTEYPEPINGQTIQFAISSYVSSLTGFNSPFDKYVRGESKSIHADVKAGFNLFMGKAGCGSCHFAPVFNGTVPPFYSESESEVLGVPVNPYLKKPILDPDPGRGAALLKEHAPFYMHSFKTPTIRNIEFTAPYMHNGAYKTLEDVMDFYNKGGGIGIGIEVEYQTLPSDKLHLSKKEVSQIISFMKALSDTSNVGSAPAKLPIVEGAPSLNTRKIGGEY